MSQTLQQVAKEIADALTLELAATPKQFVYAIADASKAAQNLNQPAAISCAPRFRPIL